MKEFNCKLHRRAQNQYSFFFFASSKTSAHFVFKMIFDAAVHAAFIEKIDAFHKEKRVQCRYCMNELRAKHTSRQRKHLFGCTAYFNHMRRNFLSNSIVRFAASSIMFIVQTFLFSIISRVKREELNKMTAMAIYCEGRSLSMFEDLWMEEFFSKSIDYRSSRKTRLSENLLDEAYMRTKATMTKIFDSSSILNVMIDESDNQIEKKILNMCVLIFNKQSFHIILESVESMQLNVRNEVIWIIRQLDNLTDNFNKICSLATDTCSVQQSV